MCSMCLTITMAMCMLVLLILDGLLDTLMLSMVPLVTLLLLYSLRVFLPILTLVNELMCEGFDWLDCVIGRYWEMVERLKIKQFYTAPTAIRLLLKCGDHFVHQYNRDTLRVLGCDEHVCKFI